MEMCKNCTQVCPGGGCAPWQRAFADNWDKNIHRKVSGALLTRHVFAYEHPDRVREQRAAAQTASPEEEETDG